MTKEKLKKEAEHCVHEMLFWLNMPINEKNVKEGSSYILELLKPRENRIVELEKENAELKERLKEHEIVGNAQFWENVWSWNAKAEQFTKAIEIISRYYKYNPSCEYSYEDIDREAEQFLRDEGCPDCFCEDCTKDCGVKELGLVEVKK